VTRHGLCLWVFIVIAPAIAAQEPTVVARVIDGSTDRIPSLTVAPEYPRKARRDRVEGRVQVCFNVNRKGKTHRIAVRNSTNRAFEKPSIKAVRASSFRPIAKDEPVPAIKACRTFIFSLEPVETHGDASEGVDQAN
jgi:TonB family protein